MKFKHLENVPDTFQWKGEAYVTGARSGAGDAGGVPWGYVPQVHLEPEQPVDPESGVPDSEVNHAPLPEQAPA